MSDKFNPLHYLDKRLLEEPIQEKRVFDWKTHLLKRKKEFFDFKFIVINHNNILHNELLIQIQSNEQRTQFKIPEQPNVKNIFLLKIHDAEKELKEFFYLPNNSIIVHEDISIQKSKQDLNVICNKENEYYYLTNHLSPQLFFNKIEFKVADKLKCFFITLNNNQKHKNQITHYLNPHSVLVHKNFSDIQKEQLQDDSIEVIHSKYSNSDIFYESLNRGKISTQINSIINRTSIKCSTKQSIKHIVLDKFAITNSKPNLIIENNNVDASHGNSIGYFNSEDIFYLSQRGFTKEQIYSVLSDSKLIEFISNTSINKQLYFYIKGLKHK